MIKGKNGNLTIYVGSKKVKAGYLGTIKVYPNELLEVTPSLSFVAAGEKKQLVITVLDEQTWSLTGVPSDWIISATSETGPATIDITASNNETSEVVSGTIIVTSGDLTAECALSQEAGIQTFEYSEWVTNSIDVESSKNNLIASGESITLTAYANQTRNKYTKWNGITTDTEEESQRIDVSEYTTFAKDSGEGSVLGRTVTFTNNTTESERSGIYKATYDDAENSITITQSAGSKVYSQWTNQSLSIDTTTFEASGGSTSAIINVKRTYTWNGVEGSGGEETSTASLQTPQSSDPIATISGNTINVASLSTTIKDQTVITISANTEYDSTRVSTTIIQKANNVIYGIPTGLSLAVGQIPASGGTISSGTISGTISQSRTFTSGASDTINPTASSTSYSSPITAGSKGTTQSGVTTVGTLTYYYTCNGKQGSCSATVQQAANNIKSYGTPTGRTLSVSDIPASGGSISSGSLGGTITQSRTWDSGSSDTLTNPSVSASSYSSAVSAGNLGGTSKARTQVGTLTYYYTCNGVRGSASAAVYQQANSMTYGSTFIEISGSQSTSKNISIAYNVTYAEFTLSQKQNYTYTSGYSGITNTSQKPSFNSSSGAFTVKDISNYGGNSTLPTYTFGISTSQNTGASSRSGTFTFTWSNGDKVVITITQASQPKAHNDFKLVADSNTISNGVLTSITIAWGTSNGNYPNSKTFTGNQLSTSGNEIYLGLFPANQTIYFKFTGSIGMILRGNWLRFTSNQISLSGTTSYNMATSFEISGTTTSSNTTKILNVTLGM